MAPLTAGALAPHVLALEQARDSRVLVLAASNLDTDILPALYECCLEIGPTARLDVLLHGRGGEVHVARRIGLLLREHCRHLAFIVPFHCASAATLLTLCADEIVAGPLALFTPIDPLLNGADGSAHSALDIERFGAMAERWFGVDPASCGTDALALLCASIAPTSLVAFYRATCEVAQVAEELLAFQLGEHQAERRRHAVQQLMAAYHSHSHTLTGAELAALGLRVRSDPALMRHGWAISRLLQAHLGGARRTEPDMPWIDVLLATRDSVAMRRRQADDALGTEWTGGSAP